MVVWEISVPRFQTVTWPLSHPNSVLLLHPTPQRAHMDVYGTQTCIRKYCPWLPQTVTPLLSIGEGVHTLMISLVLGRTDLGRRHAEDLKASLGPLGKRIKVIQLPGARSRRGTDLQMGLSPWLWRYLILLRKVQLEVHCKVQVRWASLG